MSVFSSFGSCSLEVLVVCLSDVFCFFALCSMVLLLLSFCVVVSIFLWFSSVFHTILLISPFRISSTSSGFLFFPGSVSFLSCSVSVCFFDVVVGPNMPVISSLGKRPHSDFLFMLTVLGCFIAMYTASITVLLIIKSGLFSVMLEHSVCHKRRAGVSVFLHLWNAPSFSGTTTFLSRQCTLLLLGLVVVGTLSSLPDIRHFLYGS